MPRRTPKRTAHLRQPSRTPATSYWPCRVPAPRFLAITPSDTRSCSCRLRCYAQLRIEGPDGATYYSLPLVAAANKVRADLSSGQRTGDIFTVHAPLGDR